MDNQRVSSALSQPIHLAASMTLQGIYGKIATLSGRENQMRSDTAFGILFTFCNFDLHLLCIDQVTLCLS